MLRNFSKSVLDIGRHWEISSKSFSLSLTLFLLSLIVNLVSWREKKIFHEEITLKLSFYCQSTWDTRFFQSSSNSCYHYCWFISWCRGKNSFMGTLRGHNWIILAVINGSANRSLNCYETNFHNFWIKANAPGQKDAQSGGEACSLTSWAGAPLTQLWWTSLSCKQLKQYYTAITFSFLWWEKIICKPLWGAVNQDWYLKMLLKNVKALLFFSLPPKLAQGFCLYRNK